MTTDDYLALGFYKDMLKGDFATFVQRCFYELNPGTPYSHNWHIDIITAYLEACLWGDTKRLIINVPPRHLKSIIASVAFPAWILGQKPSAQIICISYGQELAEKLARDCRQVMTSSWYKALFPKTVILKNAAMEITTTKSGCRYATSIGGAITGRGADYIIIDDPLKPEEAASDVARKHVNETFDSTILSRLNDKKTGRIIIIMQRLHQDDLVGHVMGQDEWKHLCFPAIATEDETYTVKTMFGPETFVRKEGDLLHPDREPSEVLRMLRRTLGEAKFAGQYQQNPVPAGGAMIKDGWLIRCRTVELPTAYDQIIQSWDTANKIGELTDYSVCTSWGLKGGKFYLTNVFRKKMEFPELKANVKRLQQQFGATTVIVEDQASGTQLIQDLRHEGLPQITGLIPKGDKQMRMYALTPMFENGLIVIPEDAHWYGDYINELMSFPYGKHDDQVDSTSQFLQWCSNLKNQPGYGLMKYYEEMYEQKF